VLDIVPDEDDDGGLAQQWHSPKSGGKSKPKAQTRQEHQPIADPETGEKLVNLNPLFLRTIQGADRPVFIAWLKEEHGIDQLTKVPASKEKDVREAIEAKGRGEEPKDPGRPFTDDPGADA